MSVNFKIRIIFRYLLYQIKAEGLVIIEEHVWTFEY